MSLFMVDNSTPKFSSLIFIPLKIISPVVFCSWVLVGLFPDELGLLALVLVSYLFGLLDLSDSMLELIFEKQFVGLM